MNTKKIKQPAFDKTPTLKVSPSESDCTVGWDAIVNDINEYVSKADKKDFKVVIDCYQGVDQEELKTAIEKLNLKHCFDSASCLKKHEEVQSMVYPYVTDDRIFGKMTSLELNDFFDDHKKADLQQQMKDIQEPILIYGLGAGVLCEEPDLFIYLDMPRWELQQRMRAARVNNLGVLNKSDDFFKLYKQSFFVDWRVLDKHKQLTYDRWDYCIDTVKAGEPKMISRAFLNKAYDLAVSQPFRLMPFFDPGPWGGQWLKEVIGLDKDQINFAWGFDCVPEENSLLLGFGDQRLEIPALNLVLERPRQLMGDFIYEKFGAEFPIRFDFLDTMEGGNLSLQVHPTTKYMYKQFGMKYTQNESYYILDAKEDAFVYLGLKDETKASEMVPALKDAQKGNQGFDAEKFVKKWPVHKHDHFSIPAGTVHCSGKNSVVLEISATPYIFTFKLWDWGRLGLDGKPRPINIEHGEQVISWDKKEDWVKKKLVSPIEVIAEGPGWKEERTGLDDSQFIETRRHWFTAKVLHKNHGTVNVLNLVEGAEALVESPTGKFEPYQVHYAETFIIPATVDEYTIRPYGTGQGMPCATLKAYVREDNWDAGWIMPN